METGEGPFNPDESQGRDWLGSGLRTAKHAMKTRVLQPFPSIKCAAGTFWVLLDPVLELKAQQEEYKLLTLSITRLLEMLLSVVGQTALEVVDNIAEWFEDLCLDFKECMDRISTDVAVLGSNTRIRHGFNPRQLENILDSHQKTVNKIISSLIVGSSTQVGFHGAGSHGGIIIHTHLNGSERPPQDFPIMQKILVRSHRAHQTAFTLPSHTIQGSTHSLWQHEMPRPDIFYLSLGAEHLLLSIFDAIAEDCRGLSARITLVINALQEVLKNYSKTVAGSDRFNKLCLDIQMYMVKISSDIATLTFLVRKRRYLSELQVRDLFRQHKDNFNKFLFDLIVSIDPLELLV